jgi:hypothetical protein
MQQQDEQSKLIYSTSLQEIYLVNDVISLIMMRVRDTKEFLSDKSMIIAIKHATLNFRNAVSQSIFFQVLFHF